MRTAFAVFFKAITFINIKDDMPERKRKRMPSEVVCRQLRRRVHDAIFPTPGQDNLRQRYFFAGGEGIAAGGAGIVFCGQGAIHAWLCPCMQQGTWPDMILIPAISAKSAHNHRRTATTVANDLRPLPAAFSRVNSTKKLMVKVMVIGNNANIPTNRNIVYLLTELLCSAYGALLFPACPF